MPRPMMRRTSRLVDMGNAPPEVFEERMVPLSTPNSQAPTPKYANSHWLLGVGRWVLGVGSRRALEAEDGADRSAREAEVPLGRS